MEIARKWAMPNHKTFIIKPIKELLAQEVKGVVVDPFPFPFDRDAVEYLKEVDSLSVDTVLFDPPYSQRQLKEMYNSNGLSLNHPMNSSYWRKCKDEISRILKRKGTCISFGWNTNAIGKKRGFTIKRILIVAHGGQHNDTLVTVEEKNEI